MRNLYKLLLFFFSLSAFGQTKIDRDTIVDFWNQQTYKQRSGYNNRVVETNGKLLYVKISFSGQLQANFEYFHINDSLFNCIEYYPSSNIRASGDYIVTKNLAPNIDTLFSGEINDPGEFWKDIIYFKQIVKTGKWIERSDYCCIDKYGDYWEGEYKQGKRIGIWKHLISNFNNDIELEQLNYNADLLKPIYIKNLTYTSPLENLEKTISGKWTIGCEDSTSLRIMLTKCILYNGDYGDICGDKTNYYDFSTVNKFKRQTGEGCNKFKQTSLKGIWSILKDGANTFININFAESKENWKLKIIYMDKNGTLVAERQ
jgi:hypothetical protein